MGANHLCTHAKESTHADNYSSCLVVTTKFGNPSIGDEDGIEAEFEMEIAPETERGSAEVRIGYDWDQQSSSWMR